MPTPSPQTTPQANILDFKAASESDKKASTKPFEKIMRQVVECITGNRNAKAGEKHSSPGIGQFLGAMYGQASSQANNQAKSSEPGMAVYNGAGANKKRAAALLIGATIAMAPGLSQASFLGDMSDVMRSVGGATRAAASTSRSVERASDALSRDKVDVRAISRAVRGAANAMRHADRAAQHTGDAVNGAKDMMPDDPEEENSSAPTP